MVVVRRILDPQSRLQLAQGLVDLAKSVCVLTPGEESALQLQNSEKILRETMRQCGPRLVKEA